MNPLEFLLLSLALWTGLSLLALAAWCWAASRRKPHPEPVVESCDCENPLYLTGYELDSRFYGVIAESYR